MIRRVAADPSQTFTEHWAFRPQQRQQQGPGVLQRAALPVPPGLLKTPLRDGTTYLVMSTLEFMQGLAALVPRPRLHLIRFYGVLALSSTTSAKLRALVVPREVLQAPKPAPQEAKPAECEAKCAHRRLVRLS